MHLHLASTKYNIKKLIIKRNQKENDNYTRRLKMKINIVKELKIALRCYCFAVKKLFLNRNLNKKASKRRNLQ